MKQTYIGGIQRFSTEDGPGIRTTVFFKGCPLHCRWCHNPELLDPSYTLMYRKKDCNRCGRCIRSCPEKALSFQAERVVIDHRKCKQCGRCVEACCTGALYTKSKTYSLDELLATLQKDADYYAISGGGVTFSGGEVLAHADYVCTVAEAVRKAGYTLAIETSGYGKREDLSALASLCDYILFDLKHMDRQAHKTYVGVDPERIWSNLEALARDERMREKIVIRVPQIHKINDDEANMYALRDYMQQLQLHEVHLLPYHNMGVSKAGEAGIEQEQFVTPPDEILERNRSILAATGLTVLVMGHEE